MCISEVKLYEKVIKMKFIYIRIRVEASAM
jgi:hypothetical protein